MALCWIFGKGCSSTQGLHTYTTNVNKLIDRSHTVVTQFDNLRHNIQGMSKADIDNKLSQLESDSKSIAQASAKVVVTTKATNLQPLLQLALDLRTQGIVEFQKGIDAATGGNSAGAMQSISKGLEDLVVSDQVFMRYSNSLKSNLKAANLANVQVADEGQAVPTVDDVSTASIDKYLSTSVSSASQSTTGTNQSSTASTPSQAMTDYLKNKGIDSSGMSFSVVSVSNSDPNWKLDSGDSSSGQTKYFLLHSVNGAWTVVDYGSSFSAAQMKTDRAPNDLKPPTQSTSTTPKSSQ
jgi:hypothetical protein